MLDGSWLAFAVIVVDGSPGDATVAVYVPSAVPNVHVVRNSPFESVVPVAGLNDWPEPVAGVNEMDAPATPEPTVVMTRATTCRGSGEAARPD
jgi:hypothetical protein